MIKYVLNLYHVLFCFDFAKCRDCVITLWSINDVSATLWSINDVIATLMNLPVRVDKDRSRRRLKTLNYNFFFGMV